MNPEQLLLQLGLAGAILFVVYKLGMKGLDKWSEREKEKNGVLADGFAAITTSVNTHSSADVASHERLADKVERLTNQTVRVEAKLDTALELTPVEQRRPTPPHGVPARGYYPPSRPKTSGGG